VARRESSPDTGKPSARPEPVSPGVFFHRQGAFATIPFSPLPTVSNTEAPQYAFLRQGGIYRSDVVPTENQSQNQPRPETDCLPTVGLEPKQRTRREDHALLIVRDEFRTGYSSIGLLASRARLRFTGTRKLTCTLQRHGLKGTFLLCQDGDILLCLDNFYFAVDIATVTRI
jgi:hypothetical protein